MLLTLAGIGAIFLGYEAYAKSKTTTPAIPLPASTPTGGTLPVTTQTALPAPAPSLPATSGNGAPNGIDPTVYARVMAWINQDGRPPVLAMGAAAVPSEFAGMYNIISNNLWGNSSVTDFWNALRNKYDPDHKYW